MLMARIGSPDNDGGSSQFCNNYGFDDDQSDHPLADANCSANYMSCYTTSSSSSAAGMPPSPPPISGVGFIDHPVSKLDTLAGVAIKYGVEVADIKRMNGLVSDLQMFALKSLQIPLPGRHPPSPCLSNGSPTQGQNGFEHTAPDRENCDILASFLPSRLNSYKRKVSPAMSSLQGFYGLKPAEPNIVFNGCEMTTYRKGDSVSQKRSPYLGPLPASNTSLSFHRRSRSVAVGFLHDTNKPSGDLHPGDAVEGDSEKWNERLVRRRHNSVADFSPSSRSMLVQEYISGGACLKITGKGLALRSITANKPCILIDAETGGGNAGQKTMQDSFVADGFPVVKKSSSTSSLQDQDNLSIWPTSWKQDLQALSAAAITMPIFDGLPIPATGRKNKAALD